MKNCMILRFQVRKVSSPSDAIYRQTYYKLKVWELKPKIIAICCLTSANLFRMLVIMPACFGAHSSLYAQKKFIYKNSHPDFSWQNPLTVSQAPILIAENAIWRWRPAARPLYKALMMKNHSYIVVKTHTAHNEKLAMNFAKKRKNFNYWGRLSLFCPKSTSNITCFFLNRQISAAKNWYIC